MKTLMKSTRNRCFRRIFYAFSSLLLVLSASNAVRGQGRAVIRDTDDGIKYARGQNVVPAYEGWVANPDGTYSLIFGYWNRNWEEDLAIPIGPDNHFEPGPTDRGQPTFFGPRRGKNVFEVVVPKDFGKKEVVWTLTSRGRIEKAYGSLVPTQLLTRRMVIAGGSLSAAAAATFNDDQGDESDPNKPPSITIDVAPTASVATPATVVASVSDDGLSVIRGRSARGLRLTWSTYRGPTRVIFDPDASNPPSPTGGKITTTAKFNALGTYLIRATATDAGGLATNQDVTVVVK